MSKSPGGEAGAFDRQDALRLRRTATIAAVTAAAGRASRCRCGRRRRGLRRRLRCAIRLSPALLESLPGVEAPPGIARRRVARGRRRLRTALRSRLVVRPIVGRTALRAIEAIARAKIATVIAARTEIRAGAAGTIIPAAVEIVLAI